MMPSVEVFGSIAGAGTEMSNGVSAFRGLAGLPKPAAAAAAKDVALGGELGSSIPPLATAAIAYRLMNVTRSRIEGAFPAGTAMLADPKQ